MGTLRPQQRCRCRAADVTAGDVTALQPCFVSSTSRWRRRATARWCSRIIKKFPVLFSFSYLFNHQYRPRNERTQSPPMTSAERSCQIEGATREISLAATTSPSTGGRHREVSSVYRVLLSPIPSTFSFFFSLRFFVSGFSPSLFEK